jgi:cytochrome P450
VSHVHPVPDLANIPSVVAIPVGVIRKTRTSFTFSNGVTVPPGTCIAAHMHGTHRDGIFYGHPDEFDGFRFVDEKPKVGDDGEKATLKPRQTMYRISKTYLGFGYGRHAWYTVRCFDLAPSDQLI